MFMSTWMDDTSTHDLYLDDIHGAKTAALNSVLVIHNPQPIFSLLSPSIPIKAYNNHLPTMVGNLTTATIQALIISYCTIYYMCDLKP